VPPRSAWKKVWNAPGIKGMISQANPRLLPDGFAMQVENADFSRKLGMLMKDYGFDLHEIGTTVPALMADVLSIGWMTYVKVWGDDGTKINAKMGRLYAQVDYGTTPGVLLLGYYWIEYDFAAASWGAWSTLQTDLDYGTTIPDRIRWTPFQPNVMRGATGVTADSKPIWVGYVNRKASDNNGLFKDYTFDTVAHPTTGDRVSVTDVYMGDGTPNTKCGVVQISNVYDDTANFSNEKIQIIVVPEYDGHQVTSTEQVDDFSASILYRETVSFNTLEKRALRINVNINFIDDNGEFPNPRVTALNIFVSRCPNTTFDVWTPWDWVYRVDLQTGTLGSFGRHNGMYNQGSPAVLISNWGAPLIEWPDMLKNLWVSIRRESNIRELYRVSDVVMVSNPNQALIYFTASSHTGLHQDSYYDYDLIGKWYTDNNQDFTCGIILNGTEIPQEEAPAWLPDPAKLFDLDYRIPVVSCNYRYSIEFQGMHVVGNVYHDGEWKPLQMRISNPKNHPLAGFDIFPDEQNIPSDAGDEIMGFGVAGDVLSVFTKKKLFRYTFDGGITPRLVELPWSVGLVSGDSLKEIGAVYWFLGQYMVNRKITYSIFRYDGLHEPENVGDKISGELLAALIADGCIPELAQAWLDELNQQYRVAINSFYIPNAMGTEVMPMIYDKISAGACHANQKTTEFRPGTSHLYQLVCDVDNLSGPIPIKHRLFKRCVNGATFEAFSGNAWAPHKDGLGDTSTGKSTTASFVFSEDGQYIYIVGTTAEEAIPGAGVVGYGLYIGRLDLETGTWSQAVDGYANVHMLLSWHETLVYDYPDIELDPRGYPMVVSEGHLMTSPAVRCAFLLWYDTHGALKKNIIGQRGELPYNCGSIAKQGSQVVIHVDMNGLPANNEVGYLYTFPCISGVPNPPADRNWNPLAATRLWNAMLCLSDTGIGLVGRYDCGSTLAFSLWQDNQFTTDSTLPALHTNGETDANVYALTWREGKFIVVFFDDANALYYIINQGDGTWLYGATIPTGLPGAVQNWGYFGITRKPNPAQVDPQLFAFCLNEVDQAFYTPDYTMWLVRIADWDHPVPEATFWPTGRILSSKIFGVDIKNGSTQIVTGNSNLKIMDVLEVEKSVVFVNNNLFLEFTDEFREYLDENTSTGKRLYLVLGSYDAGHSYLKLCEYLIFDGEIADGESVTVTVGNDLGESAQIVVTKDLIGVPQGVYLGGRWFNATCEENSQSESGFGSIEIGGQWMGDNN
jgi:hypothetical protein